MATAIDKVKVWVDFNLIEGIDSGILVVCELPLAVKNYFVGEYGIVLFV